MIVSFPARVELVLPDTGASRIPASRARTAPATDRIASGRTVLQSTATEPARIPAATPSGPSYSARTASSSATIEIVTSAVAAASAGVAATVAPIRSASAAAGSGERL